MVKHFLFFYLTLSYSIILFSLVLLIVTYSKFRTKSLAYMMIYLSSGALPLLFLTYLDYRYANLPQWYLTHHDVVIYSLESFCVITIPMLVNELFDVKYRRIINLLFLALLIVALALIAIPYLQSRLNDGTQIETIPEFVIYRGVIGLTHLYGLMVFALRIRWVNNRYDRRFYTASMIFALIIYSQSVVPIFRIFPENLIVYAAASFFWNLLFIKYLVERYLNAPPLTSNAFEMIMAKHKITEREKELLLLLVQGLTNNEIGAKLYISEGTVKTHIQNIYKKLGVRNRVQLFHLLKGGEEVKYAELTTEKSIKI